MASEDNRSWSASLRASVEERFVAPFKSRALAERAPFIATLAMILAVHAGVLAYLFHRDGAEQTPLVEETPVEVVVEPQPRPLRRQSTQV